MPVRRRSPGELIDCHPAYGSRRAREGQAYRSPHARYRIRPAAGAPDRLGRRHDLRPAPGRDQRRVEGAAHPSRSHPLRARTVLAVRTNLMLIAAAATGVFFFAGVRTFTVVFIHGHYRVPEAVATSRRPPRRRPAAPVGPRRERPLAAAGAGVRGGAARLRLVRGPSRPRTRGGIQLAFLLM